jgi:hypothetical protein
MQSSIKHSAALALHQVLDESHGSSNEELAVRAGEALAGVCGLNPAICSSVVHSALTHLEHQEMSRDELVSRVLANLRLPQLA